MTEQNLAQKELSPVEQTAEVLARQQEINQSEWLRADNWGGPKTLAVYFSKKDNRIWVPQQRPALGWTLNLAHKGGVLWLVGICVGIILVMVVITVVAGDLLARYSGLEM